MATLDAPSRGSLDERTADAPSRMPWMHADLRDVCGPLDLFDQEAGDRPVVWVNRDEGATAPHVGRQCSDATRLVVGDHKHAQLGMTFRTGPTPERAVML